MQNAKFVISCGAKNTTSYSVYYVVLLRLTYTCDIIKLLFFLSSSVIGILRLINNGFATTYIFADAFGDRIFKLLRSPGIDSKKSIPSEYVAWRADTITVFLLGS
jgi:hypothetical protein